MTRVNHHCLGFPSLQAIMIGIIGVVFWIPGVIPGDEGILLNPGVNPGDDHVHWLHGIKEKARDNLGLEMLLLLVSWCVCCTGFTRFQTDNTCKQTQPPTGIFSLFHQYEFLTCCTLSIGNCLNKVDSTGKRSGVKIK